MNRFARSRAIAVSLLFAFAGCSGSAIECRVGADCASGACSRTGMCLPLGTGPGGQDAGPSTVLDGGANVPPPADSGASTPGEDVGPQGDRDAGGSSGGRDALPAHDSGTPAMDSGTAPHDGGSPSCLPNNDDSIDRAEVPVTAGLHAVFQIAEGATIDTAGTTDGNGVHHWDLTAAQSGDHRVEITTDSPMGQWFSSDFPDATYVSKLSDSSDLLGVFKVTDTSLQLLGVVSPSDGPAKTELTYNPPIDTLDFPITVGKQWSTDSVVTGLTQGLLSNFSESYQSTADFSGEIATPYGRFHVLRVRTVLTRTVGFQITVIRTDIFATDCFGSVATIVSENNEPNDEFTSAAEVRRLSP